MGKYLLCLYVFLASVAFCLIFELRRWQYILTASLISAGSWFLYLWLDGMGEVARYFLATIAVAILSEIFARVYKVPATVFMIIGIIPLVPGGGVYYTMKALVDGNMTLFLHKGLETAEYAGAIAVGCSLVSSFVRILTWKIRIRNKRS